MADRLLGVFRRQTLDLDLGLLMLEMSRSGAGKDAGEFRPSIGRAYIDNADSRRRNTAINPVAKRVARPSNFRDVAVARK